MIVTPRSESNKISYHLCCSQPTQLYPYNLPYFYPHTLPLESQLSHLGPTVPSIQIDLSTNKINKIKRW